jgi:hypothetical protein
MNKCEIYVFMCIYSLLIKNTEELIKGQQLSLLFFPVGSSIYTCIYIQNSLLYMF